MTGSTDAQTRHLLPLVAALGAVVSEYMAFMATKTPEEPKLFAARHAAGKAAVGHITAISRLLQSALTAPAATAAPDAADRAAVDELLAAAREAMSRYEEEGEQDA